MLNFFGGRLPFPLFRENQQGASVYWGDNATRDNQLKASSIDIEMFTASSEQLHTNRWWDLGWWG